MLEPFGDSGVERDRDTCCFASFWFCRRSGSSSRCSRGRCITRVSERVRFFPIREAKVEGVTLCLNPSWKERSAGVDSNDNEEDASVGASGESETGGKFRVSL